MPVPSAPLLPVLERRSEIEDLIRRHQVVILCGQTGSGKSTQLPQICLDLLRSQALGPGARGIIGHTQPRRLAARAVASRIAEEQHSALGTLVGFKVRFEDRTSRETRIKVMTDGTLLAELAGDPDLRAYSVLIIDEAHERSLNIDFLLGYLRRLLPRRPDLKVIITSATIDPRRFSDFLGGPLVAPVIEISGRSFPVEIRYARAPSADDDDFDRLEPEAVADAVDELTSPRFPPGDILVFLPGEREIRMAADAISRRRTDADVLPLFSRLTNQEQDRIFHPSPTGRRRVILATNVAETSLTVPGIRSVVDAGLARINRYDASRKIQTLPVEPVSRASADQRAGRCGRVAAGVCIRLYSEESYRARAAFTPPEIRRTSLAGAILQMASLGLGPIADFPFLDPPDAEAIKDGHETLFELGAIDAPDATGTITPTGRRMARTPLDPRIARMVLGAEREGALAEILVLASALSIQDPRERPMARQEQADSAQAVFRHPTSDFLSLLNLWAQARHAGETLSRGELFGWCREHFVSATRLREWIELHHQLRRVAEELSLTINTTPASPDAIHRSLLTGLITHAACREGEAGSFDYRGVRGNTLQIFPGSVLFKKAPKWIMAAEVVHTSRVFARTVAAIDQRWLEDLASHMVKRQVTDHHLDSETGTPSAWERVTMSGIVIVPRRRIELASVDPEAARNIFIADALVDQRWTTDSPALCHNAIVFAHARAVEGKIRRTDALRSREDLVAWFDARLPKTITGPESLARWLADQPNHTLELALSDVVTPSAFSATDTAIFPDVLDIEGIPEPAPLTYALAPGRDEDGVTLTLTLAGLARLNPDRPAWLVPGLLPELVLALVKQLPKAQRSALDSHPSPTSLAGTARDIAELVDFASGPLSASLSNAVQILYALKVDPGLWPIRSLPPHLRLRLRVVDEHGKTLGEDRDLAPLLEGFAGRISKLQTQRRRSKFEQTGLTGWTFDELPESLIPEPGGPTMYPGLLDAGRSVTLTLFATPADAALHTPRGLRRLFALACAEELGYTFDALPIVQESVKAYKPLGSAEELQDAMICLTVERVFLAAQAPIRSGQQFEERLASGRGRLAQIARDTAQTIHTILEPRARVAHRLSGGTPRLWAASIADIREHAAYLMPRGFLLLVPWEHLRRYPAYAESMRQRLFALREEGSKAETDALRVFGPHWKKFTAWVAAQQSAERARLEAHPATTQKPDARKAPLPQTRRSGQTVNLDAGEWAMLPGNLPGPVERYRWALEELRLGLFTPELGNAGITAGAMAKLWESVGPG